MILEQVGRKSILIPLAILFGSALNDLYKFFFVVRPGARPAALTILSFHPSFSTPTRVFFILGSLMVVFGIAGIAYIGIKTPQINERIAAFSLATSLLLFQFGGFLIRVVSRTSLKLADMVLISACLQQVILFYKKNPMAGVADESKRRMSPISIVLITVLIFFLFVIVSHHFATLLLRDHSVLDK